MPRNRLHEHPFLIELLLRRAVERQHVNEAAAGQHHFRSARVPGDGRDAVGCAGDGANRRAVGSPDLNAAFVAGRCQIATVRAPGHVAEFAAVHRFRCDGRSVGLPDAQPGNAFCHIETVDNAVAHRGKARAVRAPLDGRHRTAVPFENLERRAVRLPDVHHVIIVAGGERRSVGTPGHRANANDVTAINRAGRSVATVNSHGTVVAGRCDVLRVGAPSHAVDVGMMIEQGAVRAVSEVPDVHRGIGSARSDVPAIGAKGDAMDSRLMADQHALQFHCLGIVDADAIRLAECNQSAVAAPVNRPHKTSQRFTDERSHVRRRGPKRSCRPAADSLHHLLRAVLRRRSMRPLRPHRPKPCRQSRPRQWLRPCRLSAMQSPASKAADGAAFLSSTARMRLSNCDRCAMPTAATDTKRLGRDNMVTSIKCLA